MPTISIVMPSMNEENTIGICIKKAQKVFEHYGVEGEVVVVDNSTDHTPQIASSMGAKVIHSVKGYGNAYIAGLSHAKGDYIIIADADDTYDFEELPNFLDYLMNDEADFVIGTRLKGNIKKGAMPWLHQYIGNPFLTWLLNVLFKANISDAHCGMRAFTREAFNKINLKTHGMELASEMVIEATYKKLRIKEVPITYHPREAPSKLRSFEDGWRHIRFMMLYHPVPFLYIPGAFVFLLGFLTTLSLILQGNVDNRAHSFILGSMLLVIGGQILATGTYMKTYGIIHGVYKRKSLNDYKFLNYHSLEMELLAGAIMLVIGMLLGAKVAYIWISAGYGSILEIEYAVMAMVFGAIGVQLVFSAIFLSVMLLNADTDW
jgi:glycosyltransferase involved in cell wall biosynthesis